ncbi:MAG TPA: type II toxin-antitoxin system VapC family toxin [Sedimentisphaerales bacterium]|jgi:predicted nucleic acid-binding protein|nr:type II toxin-antitoxin system VapC family toxin [Sedimentisphaerales bacterium]
MKPIVLDASAVAAAFFAESHGDAAQRLLVSGGKLYAPDLIYAEVANVIWKRRGRQEIDDAEAAELLTDLLGLPLDITPSEQLVVPALNLAMRTGRTVYDCLYVALTVQTKSVMFSNDRRLVNAFADGPLKDRVLWLGEAE